MANKSQGMTLAEYRAKQMEIKSQINSYRMDSCSKQADIAMNEREIVKLDQQLIELHEEFLRYNDMEEGL